MCSAHVRGCPFRTPKCPAHSVPEATPIQESLKHHMVLLHDRSKTTDRPDEVWAHLHRQEQ